MIIEDKILNIIEEEFSKWNIQCNQQYIDLVIDNTLEDCRWRCNNGRYDKRFTDLLATNVEYVIRNYCFS